MRNDMTRVLVGCPRSGYNHKPSRSGDRLLLRNSDCEVTSDLVMQQPLGHRSRESRVNRKPLERFLRKQVGRPWDQVYSEIAAKAPSNTWLGDKLREEVSWLVDVDVAWRDGTLVGRWGYAPSDLFVHPESGLLSLPESRPRRKYVHKKEYEMVDVDVRHKYVRIGALWYLVTLKDLPVCEPEVCHQLPRRTVSTSSCSASPSATSRAASTATSSATSGAATCWPPASVRPARRRFAGSPRSWPGAPRAVRAMAPARAARARTAA